MMFFVSLSCSLVYVSSSLMSSSSSMVSAGVDLVSCLCSCSISSRLLMSPVSPLLTLFSVYGNLRIEILLQVVLSSLCGVVVLLDFYYMFRIVGYLELECYILQVLRPYIFLCCYGNVFLIILAFVLGLMRIFVSGRC